MEIQANPDLEQLKLILWITIPVLAALLMIVGYFIRESFQASKNLTDAVNTLTMTVTALKTQLELQSPVTEHRLNDHSDRIMKIDKRLLVIETDHLNFHKTKIRHEKDS